jgi:hypothetical protein
MAGKKAQKPEVKKGAEAAQAPAPKRSLLLPIILCVAGLAIGAGGVAGYFLFLHKPANAAAAEHKEEASAEAKKEESDFVTVDRIMVPMIDRQGKLVSYASVDLELEVAAEDRGEADMNVALARAGITRRMSQETVVTLADSGVIDYDRADAILTEAVNEGYGKPIVRKVHIVSIVAM